MKTITGPQETRRVFSSTSEGWADYILRGASFWTCLNLPLHCKCKCLFTSLPLHCKWHSILTPSQRIMGYKCQRQACINAVSPEKSFTSYPFSVLIAWDTLQDCRPSQKYTNQVRFAKRKLWGKLRHRDKHYTHKILLKTENHIQTKHCKPILASLALEYRCISRKCIE